MKPAASLLIAERAVWELAVTKGFLTVIITGFCYWKGLRLCMFVKYAGLN